jgi:hypothetical protein
VADEQDFRGDQDLSGAFVKMLNQGFQRGHPIVVCDTASKSMDPQKFEVFGPKLLVSRKRFPDDALETRCFTIRMYPRTREDIPLNLPREQFDAEALMLRNKLLRWRFDRYHTVKLDPSLAVAGIEDRLNQIGVPLLSTISSQESRQEIQKHLQGIQDDLVQTWQDSDRARIVRYLRKRWQEQDACVYVGQIANDLNSSRADEAGLQVYFALTAKKAGTIVRDALGFTTARQEKGYMVIRDFQRLAELEKRYGTDERSA